VGVGDGEGVGVWQKVFPGTGITKLSS